MRFASHFECPHTFPDDVVWEGDFVVQPGGKELAQVVAGMLRDRGYADAEPEINLEHESWDMVVKRGGKTYYVQVTDLDEVIITAYEMGESGEEKPAPSLIIRLFELFRADPRFGEPAWM